MSPRNRQTLEALAAHVLQVLDEERRQTSRFLHDAAGQNLLGLRMNLSRLLSGTAIEDVATRELLSESVQLTEKSLDEIRFLSYALHPPILDFAGLAPSLRLYATAISHRTGFGISLDVPPDLGRLSQETETAIFRIAQEAIANARLHSGADSVSVCVRRDAAFVALVVEDSGHGIESPPDVDSAGPAQRFGFGLLAMEERVRRLGGNFELSSQPEKGTRIRVTLPVEAPAAASPAAAAAAGSAG